MKQKIKYLQQLLLWSILLLASCQDEPCDRKLPGGVDVGILDPGVRPQDDFYRYACGGWIRNHPLTSGQNEISTLEQARTAVKNWKEEYLQSQLRNTPAEGTDERKMVDVYRAGMDEAGRNAAGITPLQPMLRRIEALQTRSEIAAWLGEMQKDGHALIFTAATDPGFADPTRYKLYIDGAGALSLPPADYSAKIEPYSRFMTDILQLAGYTADESQRILRSVLAVEKKLAAVALPETDKVRVELYYKEITWGECAARVPGFDWTAFIQAVGAGGETGLVLQDPEAALTGFSIMAEEETTRLKDYFRWRLLSGHIYYLTQPMFERAIKAAEELYWGGPEGYTMQKSVTDDIKDRFYLLFEKQYVHQHVTPADRERLTRMFRQVQEAYIRRIQQAGWLSEATRKLAVEKVEAVRFYIGGPERELDYTQLEIRQNSYCEQMAAMQAWQHRQVMARMGKPVDRKYWPEKGDEVNAFYWPSQNSIYICAGWMQPPYYDRTWDDATLYGAVGETIGHELTHALDSEGRRFDKDGVLAEWWPATDIAAFDARCRQVVEFYNRIEVLPGVYIDGEYTLVENIADLGGTQLAYEALMTVTRNDETPDRNGYTASQRFYISKAYCEARNITDNHLIYTMQNDTHAPAGVRINAACMNHPAWQKAFGVKPGDRMYVAPGDECGVW